MQTPAFILEVAKRRGITLRVVVDSPGSRAVILKPRPRRLSQELEIGLRLFAAELAALLRPACSVCALPLPDDFDFCPECRKCE